MARDRGEKRAEGMSYNNRKRDSTTAGDRETVASAAGDEMTRRGYRIRLNRVWQSRKPKRLTAFLRVTHSDEMVPVPFSRFSSFFFSFFYSERFIPGTRMHEIYGSRKFKQKRSKVKFIGFRARKPEKHPRDRVTFPVDALRVHRTGYPVLASWLFFRAQMYLHHETLPSER